MQGNEASGWPPSLVFRKRLKEIRKWPILTNLHFIRTKLVLSVDFYQEKNTPQYMADRTKVLLFIVPKIKLKIPYQSQHKGALHREVFPGYIFKLPLTCAGQIQNGGVLKARKVSCKSMKEPLLFLLVVKLKSRYIYQKVAVDGLLFYRRIFGVSIELCCRILPERETSMFWVKISGTRFCPLTAYVGVLIELYTTKVLMIWPLWDSNPRLRRDWA